MDKILCQNLKDIGLPISRPSRGVAYEELDKNLYNLLYYCVLSLNIEKQAGS